MNPTETQIIARMDYDTYSKLAASLPRPTVTDKTTDIQAGFQLGVAAVLERLREGFVIGTR